MKHILTILILINLAIQATTGGIVLLSNAQPFTPGEHFYRLQRSAEQARLQLSSNVERRASFAVRLAERRLAELSRAGEIAQVQARGVDFTHSLDQAVAQLAELPQANRQAQLSVLQGFAVQAGEVLAAQSGSLSAELVSSLSAQIARSLDTRNAAAPHPAQPANPRVVSAAVAAVRISVPAAVPARAVTFLEQPVEHEGFPLEEGHAGVACQACHITGEYAGTPSTCQACHALPDPQPALAAYERNYPEMEPSYAEHFPGACDDCHGRVDWKPTAFNHATVVECGSCHAADTPRIAAAPSKAASFFVAYAPAVSYLLEGPADHYPGECQGCHQDTADWQESAFDHAGVSECASCHAAEAPARHLPGACANCHANVEDWADAQVNHKGYSACLDCHLADDPAEHYPGRCSNCHSVQTWSQAVFNHVGFEDCRSCHQKPGEHYPGQCLTCHAEADWSDTDFGHSDQYYDCQGCHRLVESSQHYTSRCTDCHGTAQWAGAVYTHSDGTNCQDCHQADNNHYSGQCSNCHNTFNWADASMDHTGYPDCASCHPAPDDHWAGECTTCHSVESWVEGTIAHDAGATCSACHPSPMDHFLGECSTCHVVEAWQPAVFDHTGYSDCLDCHAGDAPAAHWPGQCSDCHFVTVWTDYVFNHTGYNNCNACHQRPSNHFQRGQCSNCHTTDTWVIPTITPLAGRRDISGAIPLPTPLAEDDIAVKTLEPPSSREIAIPTPEAESTIQPPTSR